MHERRLIGQPAPETPPELRSRSGRARPLPPDLLRQASRRLQIMALVAATLWVTAPRGGPGALAVSPPGPPGWGYAVAAAGLRPDVQYCFDLELPAHFKPMPRDGEI